MTNKQLVPSCRPDRPLKSAAAREVAANLSSEGLDAADQITNAGAQDRAAVQRVIERAHGVGPARWAYLLMLLGTHGVKADTLVTAFVREHVDANPGVVEALVAAAADRLGVTPTELDHAIWRYESDRRAEG